MADDTEVRQALCVTIRDNMEKLRERQNEQRARVGQLVSATDDVQREIGERQARIRQLVTLPRIPPRLGERPSIPGAVLETIPDLVVEIEKGRLEDEIRQFEAMLRSLQSQRREAERLIEEARYNWDRSAEAYQRYGCDEFNRGRGR